MKFNQYVGRNMSNITKHFKIYFNYGLKPYGLTASQGVVLLVLYGNDGVNQEQLIEVLNYDKSVMARVVKSLVELGYIERRVNPKDKRAYELYLTNKMDEIKPVIFDLLKEWDKSLMEFLTEEELLLLNGTIEKINKRAQLKSKEMKENYESGKRKS
ncbi:MarR family winged helix-turn-helix transcriptional regulator [Oceanirhabdus seepicola]|uniref:MarR family transcriptional regulator n=1 Tax=Oceanirhabdus seepicola TaxID=2828781 RepID=A0A9J6NW74_9CLOT|nr:MarR family transcriptional regulator [Oceanirhabdus seepicola]MCM1988246.1 MarR family transcriptional regulator [Oceanirhabdus seepicola]